MSTAAASSLTDLLEVSAARFGSADALTHRARSGEGDLTYRQLLACARRGAGGLARAGLRRGDRVLLALEPGPDWGASLFAILYAGLTAVPVAIGLPRSQVRAMAASAGATAALVSDGTRALVAGAACVPLTARPLLEHGEAADVVAPADVAVLAFTSGSTDRPRAVELTPCNLRANLDAFLGVRRAAPGDRFLSILPPAHLFELMVGLLVPLASGATVVYPGAPLPNRLVQALREDGITHALAVPALLRALHDEVLRELAESGLVAPAPRQVPRETVRRLLAESAERRDRLRVGVRERIGESLQTLVVGGAALEPAWTELLATLGIGLELGYGLTEHAPVVSVGVAGECPPGSVGRALPGVDLRVDRSGEILVRGPSVMRGYYRDPEATARVIEGGWLRTGDRGRIDERGYLFVTGRAKEAMVTAAGETIHPEEVEPHYADPLFAELCVSGLPGADGNDVPTLFVVSEASDRVLAEKVSALRAAAPPRLRVERFLRVPGPLPRTASGKLRRRELAARAPARARVEGELRRVLSEHSGRDLDGVGLDRDLVEELGLDSLDALRLLAAVEKRFDARLPDERLGELRTLRAILANLVEKEDRR